MVLALVQALGIAIFLERQTNIAGGLPLVYNPGWGFRLMTHADADDGHGFIMWLGEQITERGIGNGMSLHHLRRHRRRPAAGGDSRRSISCAPARSGLLRLLFLMVMMVVVIAAIIFVERGQRRITVQYAKRVVGRRHVRRHEHAHPAEGQHGRRHPGDLRLVAAGVPGHASRRLFAAAAGSGR